MLNSILNFVLGSMPDAPSEPEPLTHMTWARQQLPLSSAIRSLMHVEINPSVHRCRIGKITLKQSDRRV